MKMKPSILLMIAVLVGLMATSIGSAQSQDKETFYICFDNSWSMKRYQFYHRLIGALMLNLEREGLSNTIEIKYVPFGTRRPLRIFDNYRRFSRYIDQRTYATTDFRPLGNTLTRIDSDAKIVIISDGEHDISREPPFSNLSTTELGQMLEVVEGVNNQNISCIHILRQFRRVSQSPNIKDYYKKLRSQSPLIMGTETVVNNGETIAALTKDFMKKLVKDESQYHFCTDNNSAVQALMNIFNLSQAVSTDASKFLKRIPLDTEFPYVDRRYKLWFKEKLRAAKPCIFDVERELDIVENGRNADVKLSIEYIKSKIYSVTLDGESIWRNRRIANDSEMQRCMEKIVAAIENNIQTGFSDSPKYVVPRSFISVKFEDDKLYSFLNHNNFKVEFQTCSNGVPPPVETHFFDSGKRAYVSVPLLAADRLYITIPGDENNISGGKSFDLTEGIPNSWDAPEFTIKKGGIFYPTFFVDFIEFLNKYKGTLLFFAADTKRFFGKVGSDMNKSSIELFSNRMYWIYFVPEDIDSSVIKFCQKSLANSEDIKNALDILEPTPGVDVVHDHWEKWLETYKQAVNNAAGAMENNPDLVVRQIVQSNGYFLLLQHLGDIKRYPDKRAVFLEILNKTIELYEGTESPFKVIDLLEAGIEGFSEKLTQRYLASGADSAKIKIIIRLLSKDISSLKELRRYLNGESVSKQNGIYFKKLEG